MSIGLEWEKTLVLAVRTQALKSQETTRTVDREDLSGACLALLEQGLRDSLHADKTEHRDE
jgi:hypothetical protein